MYRKKRTIFLSRTDSDEVEPGNMWRSAIRKRYIPKFEERLNNIDISSIPNEKEFEKQLEIAQDIVTLQSIKYLLQTLSEPIKEINEMLDHVMTLRKALKPPSQLEIKQLTCKLAEMEIKVKNKTDSIITVWFSTPEERREWYQAIKKYSDNIS
ncbi:hypothetical protein GJ496_009597 [Pomphorhynchus laevis]|nr:hypothetical protein GJ496_009597 [Pomphorhynchus laevis]